MCCLKIDTETLLANCLNTCKTYSFSLDDLQQIVRLMANATDRYIFSDTGDDALHEIVTKFPDMFVYADEDRIALRSEWQHDDKKLPMAYFDFGYSAADIKQLCAAAKKHCTTQNEQLPSCTNRDSANGAVLVFFLFRTENKNAAAQIMGSSIVFCNSQRV